MTRRWSTPPTLAATLLAGILLLLPVPASFGQSIPVARNSHPDLQGLWLNNTATPLERPRSVNGRAAFTEAEAKDYESHYQLDRTVAIRAAWCTLR